MRKPVSVSPQPSALCPLPSAFCPPDEERVLAEILNALDMPRDALLRWLEHNARFCIRHGGERRYGEWLQLYEQCRAALEEKNAR
jgi:hypothetical protein